MLCVTFVPVPVHPEWVFMAWTLKENSNINTCDNICQNCQNRYFGLAEMVLNINIKLFFVENYIIKVDMVWNININFLGVKII